ncbi:unnamed protein product [Knipowitschia caucasica]
MEPNKVMQWNTRASIVYALGVWTMLGSYFFFQYTGKYDVPESSQKQEAEEKEPNPNEVVHQSGHTKTVIVYKKDFVPLSTRIMNFLDSFSAGAQSGDRGDGK